jgi:hypothetical protein
MNTKNLLAATGTSLIMFGQAMGQVYPETPSPSTPNGQDQQLTPPPRVINGAIPGPWEFPTVKLTAEEQEVQTTANNETLTRTTIKFVAESTEPEKEKQGPTNQQEWVVTLEDKDQTIIWEERLEALRPKVRGIILFIGAKLFEFSLPVEELDALEQGVYMMIIRQWGLEDKNPVRMTGTSFEILGEIHTMKEQFTGEITCYATLKLSPLWERNVTLRKRGTERITEIARKELDTWGRLMERTAESKGTRGQITASTNKRSLTLLSGGKEGQKQEVIKAIAIVNLRFFNGYHRTKQIRTAFGTITLHCKENITINTGWTRTSWTHL